MRATATILCMCGILTFIRGSFLSPSFATNKSKKAALLIPQELMDNQQFQEAAQNAFSKFDGSLLRQKLEEAGFTGHADTIPNNLESKVQSIIRYTIFSPSAPSSQSSSLYLLPSLPGNTNVTNDPEIFAEIYIAYLNPDVIDKKFASATVSFVIHSRGRRPNLEDQPQDVIKGIINLVINLYQDENNRRFLLNLIKEQIDYSARLRKQNFAKGDISSEVIIAKLGNSSKNKPILNQNVAKTLKRELDKLSLQSLDAAQSDQSSRAGDNMFDPLNFSTIGLTQA